MVSLNCITLHTRMCSLGLHVYYMLACVQGFDKVGYLKKKESVGGYKRRWFTLKGKSLSSYRRVSLLMHLYTV